MQSRTRIPAISTPSRSDPGTRLPALTYVVGAEHDAQRLDNFLLRELKGVPRQLVYRLLRIGRVRCNGRRAKPEQRLRAGDEIVLPRPRMGERAQQALRNPRLAPVAYEDGDYLVFDKPAGLAVHGGSGLSHGLIEAARQVRKQASLELVHRLDKETSGLLVVAKTRRGLLHLAAQLRDGGVAKEYRALVCGRWSGEHARIALPLRKVPAAAGGRRSVVADDGGRAETACRLLKQHAAGADLSLRLLTGKTHQARVHLASVGHPIIGDARYGSRERNRELAQRGCRGLMLHAAKLRFALPNGEKLTLTSPAPERFGRAAKALARE